MYMLGEEELTAFHVPLFFNDYFCISYVEEAKNGFCLLPLGAQYTKLKLFLSSFLLGGGPSTKLKSFAIGICFLRQYLRRSS